MPPGASNDNGGGRTAALRVAGPKHRGPMDPCVAVHVWSMTPDAGLGWRVLAWLCGLARCRGGGWAAPQQMKNKC